MQKKSIGIFDSGYGGLTILKDILTILPQYNYIYLGDNARTPYGNKSFESVYEYALQGVDFLFKQNCELVILACNTASAKALRSIQQKDLLNYGTSKRVLGVIRPCTENIQQFTKTNEVGIFATTGTVASESYIIEIKKFAPHIKVHQEACPLWVPLVENFELDNIACDYFVQKHISNLIKNHKNIDAVIMACTHYPLLLPSIKKFLPANISIISQGKLVASSLEKYLQKHQSIKDNLATNGERQFFTTGDQQIFDERASVFLGDTLHSQNVHL